MAKCIVAPLNQLNKVGDYLTEIVPKNGIIFLTGDLASGKTTLVKAIAKSKGIEDEVTSPTFSLQHRYGDKLFHYDLYRISNKEFMRLGLLEEFDREGWHLVEWGDDELKRLLMNIGYDIFTVYINPIEDKREYIMEKN